MNTKTVLPLFVAVLSMSGFQAHAAQATAQAKMKVITAVSITKVSDLIFSEASASAPAETVAADTAENMQNASFTVVGEPNRAVTVTLPADGTVTMTTSAGSGPDATVAVNQFTASPLATIAAGGSSELFVGATRSALTPTQISGDYQGDFIVDVVYQ